MTRGDIIGGLKIALSRGEKLQGAMQSFYNAGYKKEDIESAARILQSQGFVPLTVTEKKESTKFIQKKEPQEKTQTIVQPKQSSIDAQIPKSKVFTQNKISGNDKNLIRPPQKIEPRPTSEKKPFVLPPPPKKDTPESHWFKKNQKTTQTQISRPSEVPKPPVQNFIQSQKPKQVVSSYVQKEEKKTDAVTIILVIVLVVLIGILAGVFFFKGQIVEFLNKFLE